MTEYDENYEDKSDDEKKAAFAKRFIESCVYRYKIFMDTCSLLDPCAEIFWQTVVPFLQEYNRYVIIPKRCIEEVDKQITNKTDSELASRAYKVHNKLYELAIKQLVQVHGERTDGFADSVFLTVGAKYRTVYDMMLITQDRTLAREFELLGESQAVRTTRSIIARRINRFGFLSPFREGDMLLSQSPMPHSQAFSPSQDVLGGSPRAAEGASRENAYGAAIGAPRLGRGSNILPTIAPSERIEPLVYSSSDENDQQLELLPQTDAAMRDNADAPSGHGISGTQVLME